MTNEAFLIGFSRRIPDILTFVTPIFRTDSIKYVAQYDNDGSGKVTDLRKTTVDRNFEKLPLSLGTQVGYPALYGFEIEKNVIIIGTSTIMSVYFKRHLKNSPSFSKLWPQTSQAIDRFLQLDEIYPSDVETENIFEFEKLSNHKSYSLCNIENSRTLPKILGDRPKGVSEWKRILLGVLNRNHATSIAGHARAMRFIATHAINDGLRYSNPTIKVALEKILSTSSLRRDADGHLCNECLFNLLIEYPSEKSFSILLEMGTALSKKADAKSAQEDLLLDSIVEIMHAHFSHHGITEGMENSYLRYTNMLQTLQLDHRLKKKVSQILDDLGLDTEIIDWSEKEFTSNYFQLMEAQNREFFPITGNF